MAKHTHGPYVIQFGHQDKFYQAATGANQPGAWLSTAVHATPYDVKSDAQRAISVMQITRMDRMRCRVVPLHMVARDKRTASLDFGEARA